MRARGHLWPKSRADTIERDAVPFLEPDETVVRAVRVGAGHVTARTPVAVDGLLFQPTMQVPSLYYGIVVTERNLYALRLERGSHVYRKPEAVFLKLALGEVSMRFNGDRIFIRTADDPLERCFVVNGLSRRRARRLVEHVTGAS